MPVVKCVVLKAAVRGARQPNRSPGRRQSGLCRPSRVPAGHRLSGPCLCIAAGEPGPELRASAWTPVAACPAATASSSRAGNCLPDQGHRLQGRDRRGQGHAGQVRLLPLLERLRGLRHHAQSITEICEAGSGHQEPGHHGRREEVGLPSICAPTTSSEPCADNRWQALGPAFPAQGTLQHINPRLDPEQGGRALQRDPPSLRPVARWPDAFLPHFSALVAVPCVLQEHFISSVPRLAMSGRCPAVMAGRSWLDEGASAHLRCGRRHPSAKV